MHNIVDLTVFIVSTHSRPKAAEVAAQPIQAAEKVSTHSRPKAADKIRANQETMAFVSTHSRPKAADTTSSRSSAHPISFNTQPPEGG